MIREFRTTQIRMSKKDLNPGASGYLKPYHLGVYVSKMSMHRNG